MDALSTHPSRPCPDCGAVSRRVHSRYRPTLADCPVGGRPWLVRLTVRRFFQDAPTCLVCRFVEEG
ncbi:transposase family protein [Streptomyces sp. RLB3-17]|nr:transposase family protein [Streptomyces sp. RLB1-9]QDO25150.1 transposase family protein [Streptomyces sp. S1A1-8]QDO35270.1 transposase family protein [Streptomyces sp. S1A1-3]QDO45286.1 transposase family protein [Streptomyces sp. RLB3-17]